MWQPRSEAIGCEAISCHEVSVPPRTGADVTHVGDGPRKAQAGDRAGRSSGEAGVSPAGEADPADEDDAVVGTNPSAEPVGQRTHRRDRRSRVPKEDVMPLLDLFWTMFIFFLWIAWFWLLIAIFADIFRSDDLSGWGKTGWVVLTVFMPYLGVFIYLIARGRSMQDRQMRQQRELEEANAAYIRGVASAPSTTEELARLAELRDSGALTEEEFTAQKAKILAA
jgi:hypothetical protein